MNDDGHDSSRMLTWLAGACLLGILALHIYFAAGGNPIHRDQHLGTALEYAKQGVDLLHPVIVGFNATQTPTPQEVPLWQAVTAWALRWGGGWWGWGNVLAWAFFASCVFPFYQVARDALGAPAARWSVLVFLLQPLIVWQAGQGGTDGTSLAASVWFLFAASRMLATGAWRWCLAAVLLGAVAATQKLPFFLAASAASFGLLVRGSDNSPRRWLQLALAGAGAAGAFLIWNAHCERQFALAEFPLIDRRMAAVTGMREFFFGTWAERFDAGLWARGAYRALTGVFGSFCLVALALVGLAQKNQTLARWWLAGQMLVTLLFTHLVLVHWHYYLSLCPPVALLGGGALAAAESWLRERRALPTHWFVGTAAGGLLLAAIQGLHTGHFLLRDNFPRLTAQAITQHTSVSDRLLIAGGGWGGEELMLSARRGLSLWNTEPLEKPANLARLRALGYTKVVLLSQSPRLAAVAIVGGSQSARHEWRELATPVVRDWPVVWTTPELCILAVPGVTAGQPGKTP